MSTDSLHTIARLADEMKLYWSMLETAVRLDRRWSPNLQAQYTEAEQDALNLGRQLAGGARHVATLADLRVSSMEQIEYLLERLAESLGTTSDNSAKRELIHQLVADVAETARLLFLGVDIGTCRCTAARSARLRLVQRLRHDVDKESLADAAHELARLACLEAERLLEACLLACRASGALARDDYRRIN